MIDKRDLIKLNGLVSIYNISSEKSKKKVTQITGTSADTLNKYVKEFQDEMNTKFLVSNQRGAKITPEGKEILKYCDKIIEALDGLEEYADRTVSYAGTVRLGMTDAISEFLGIDSMAPFFHEYPQIHIKTIVENEMPDLDSMEADIGICYDAPKENKDNIVLISAEDISCGVYASEEYIARYGRPENMEDLIANHRICDKSNHRLYANGWKDVLEKSKNVVYSTNSIYSYRRALEAGIGIGLCPYAYAQNRLVHLSEVGFEFKIRIFLTAHKDTKDMKRIRVTLDCLKNLLAQKAAICSAVAV